MQQDSSSAFSSSLQSVTDALQAFVGNLAGICQPLTGNLGPLGAILPGLAPAFGEAIDAVRGFTKDAEKFVAALSPSTMVVFHQAIQDLYATIGTALLPMFQVFTEVLKDVAGEILAPMQELAPVVKSLAESFGNLLVPYVRMWAAYVSAIIPVFQVLADVVKIVVDALQPLFALGTALYMAFGTLIKSIVDAIQPAIKTFADMMKKASEELIKFIVSVGKALGADKFVDDFIKSLKGDKKQGEHAAGTVGLKNADALNKEIAKLAFGATGSGGDQKKSDTDRLIEELKNIKPNDAILEVKTAIKDVTDWLAKIWDKLPDNPFSSKALEDAGKRLGFGG